MNCTVDLDCNPYITNRMCNGDEKCECNTFYGWVGDKCDELGVATYVSLVFWAGFTVIFLALLVLVTKELFQRAVKSEGLTMSAANTSLIFLTLTFLGSFLRGLITMLNFVTVEGIPADAFQNGHDFFGRYEFATRAVVVPLLGAFTLLAMMNVCLMWVDISVNSKKLRPQAVANLTGTRKIIVGTQVVFVIVMVISLVVQNLTGFSLPTLMSLPFVIVVTVLYNKGNNQMHELLTSSSTAATASSSHAKLFLQSVRDTTRRCTINAIVFVILAGAYALISFVGNGAIPNLDRALHHGSGLTVSTFGIILWLYLRRKPVKLGKNTKTTVGTATSFNHTNDSSYNHNTHTNDEGFNHTMAEYSKDDHVTSHATLTL